MGQTASKKRPSDVEERLIDPLENNDLVADEGVSKNNLNDKSTTSTPVQKEHSSVSRLLKLGIYNKILMFINISLILSPDNCIVLFFLCSSS